MRYVFKGEKPANVPAQDDPSRCKRRESEAAMNLQRLLIINAVAMLAAGVVLFLWPELVPAWPESNFRGRPFSSATCWEHRNSPSLRSVFMLLS
jgi:hypothetical protein